jgi:hypothetical protein
MIRKTLKRTKDATFSIELPNHNYNGMPSPSGTGFFVSHDGWFVTAAHVITENGQSDGPKRDISKAVLSKESRFSDGDFPVPIMLQSVSLSFVDPLIDFALLKVDFQSNVTKTWLKDKKEFPYIKISSRELEEGEQVYSFGYPLPEVWVKKYFHMNIGHSGLCPRVTSAIISSTFEKQKMIMTNNDPKVYVLDKALNYGNSGGPIVATDTGKVHAFCSRFQPVLIPQHHLLDNQKRPLGIMIPSLYGVVYSLANPNIIQKLREFNITISAD